MEATQLLRADHRSVRDLFKRMDDAHPRAYQTRRALFDSIRRDVEVHLAAEIEYFYPALRSSGAEFPPGVIRRAFEGLDAIRRLLTEVSLRDARDPAFGCKLEELRSCLESHRAFAEGRIFEEAARCLPAAVRERLGSAIESQRAGVVLSAMEGSA